MPEQNLQVNEIKEFLSIVEGFAPKRDRASSTTVVFRTVEGEEIIDDTVIDEEFDPAIDDFMAMRSCSLVRSSLIRRLLPMAYRDFGQQDRGEAIAGSSRTTGVSTSPRYVRENAFRLASTRRRQRILDLP